MCSKYMSHVILTSADIFLDILIGSPLADHDGIWVSNKYIAQSSMFFSNFKTNGPMTFRIMYIPFSLSYKHGSDKLLDMRRTPITLKGLDCEMFSIFCNKGLREALVTR